MILSLSVKAKGFSATIIYNSSEDTIGTDTSNAIELLGISYNYTSMRGMLEALEQDGYVENHPVRAIKHKNTTDDEFVEELLVTVK